MQYLDNVRRHTKKSKIKYNNDDYEKLARVSLLMKSFNRKIGLKMY